MNPPRPPLRRPPLPPRPQAPKPLPVKPDTLSARFRLAAPGVRKNGTPVPEEETEAAFVILDVGDPPFMCIEHQVENPLHPGRYDVFVRCPQETQVGCPQCREANRPRFNLLLTIGEIKDLKYIGYDGQERVSRYRRRVLAAGEVYHPFFDELLMRYDSLRGVVLFAKRYDKKDPQIGKLSYVDRMSEEELVSTFGNRQVCKDGIIVKPTNIDVTPHDFNALYPQLDVKVLQQQFPTVSEAMEQLNSFFDDTKS